MHLPCPSHGIIPACVLFILEVEFMLGSSTPQHKLMLLPNKTSDFQFVRPGPRKSLCTRFLSFESRETLLFNNATTDLVKSTQAFLSSQNLCWDNMADNLQEFTSLATRLESLAFSLGNNPVTTNLSLLWKRIAEFSDFSYWLLVN